MRQVQDALQGARRLAPDAAEPLSELRLSLDQNRVVVEQDRLRFDPRTGQALLDFEMGDLERETRESLSTGVVRPLMPPADAAEVWFARASEWDADPARWESAVDAYERVVAIDPGYAAAWNNLGLLEHRMGHYGRAGERYRRALDADERCCQAAFNLGSLHEDLGDLASAIGWYRRALELEPDYADAHFNLAGVLAKSGRSEAAAIHWRRYLELDAGSPWAEIARSHLDRHAESGARRMKVLLIGGGGREHALAWTLAQSPRLTRLIAAPGNPGIAQYADCVNVKDTDIESLVALAGRERVDLTVVGPELPLSLGLVDRFREARPRGSSARARRRRASRARRPSPRTSWRAMESRLRASAPSPTPPPPAATVASWARRWSSRPTASPPARVPSCAARSRRRTAPSHSASSSERSATPAAPS